MPLVSLVITTSLFLLLMKRLLFGFISGAVLLIFFGSIMTVSAAPTSDISPVTREEFNALKNSITYVQNQIVALGQQVLQQKVTNQGTTAVNDLKKSFTQESRSVREEIYNLRQQVLELKVENSSKEFNAAFGLAVRDRNTNDLATACAQGKSSLEVDKVLWQKILDFWPLGSEHLSVLDGFEKFLKDSCGAQ